MGDDRPRSGQVRVRHADRRCLRTLTLPGFARLSLSHKGRGRQRLGSDFVTDFGAQAVDVSTDLPEAQAPRQGRPFVDSRRGKEGAPQSVPRESHDRRRKTVIDGFLLPGPSGPMAPQ